MSSVFNKIIFATITLVLAAALLPTAIGIFSNTTTEGWDTGLVSLWNILPVMGILTIVIGLVYAAVGRGK